MKTIVTPLVPITFLVLLFVAVGVAACAASSSPGAPTSSALLGARAVPSRVVDLSQPMGESTDAKIEVKNWELPMYVGFQNVTFFNHAGTHYDPPSHLIQGGKSVDAEPLDKFVGPGVLVDLRGKPAGAPLAKDDFVGRVAAGQFVLALVACAPRKDEAPLCSYLGAEAAEYLASLPVKGYATNAWTIADPAVFPKAREMKKNSQVSSAMELAPEHIALLSRGIPNFEGLANLEALVGQNGFVFVALPIKVENGSGAPVRAAAFLY